MLISLPPQLAIPADLAGATKNPYLPSTVERQRPIFSPTTSSYTQHLFHARRPSKPNLAAAAAAASMPRPNPPPTPGSSSDLRGKEGSHTAPVFHLPPTAFPEPDRASTSSATPSANGSDSSYRPLSPAGALESSRKRPAPQDGPVITKDDFALPPPPTRSRKIIQMKPQANDAGEPTPTGLSTSPQASRAQGGSQAGGKRKQNGTGTTAAGRKIARKTAHSLIERRRRSKMNEEFGVLKDMIPACKGQEMHKLAILQASIEYLRYLEKCVTDLQAQNNSPRPQPPPLSAPPSAQSDDDDDDDQDEEMEDDPEPPTATTPVSAAQDRSNSFVSLPSLSQITTTATPSPSVFSSGAGRHYSMSSASQASYSPYFHSTQTSPAFGPQLSHVPGIAPPGSAGPYRDAFGLGSPALKPLDSSSGAHQQPLRQVVEGATMELSSAAAGKRRPSSERSGRSEHELDQEATAALLMLNNDRRSWQRGQKEGGDVTARRGGGNGMSVRDLLSG